MDEIWRRLAQIIKILTNKIHDRISVRKYAILDDFVIY